MGIHQSQSIYFKNKPEPLTEKIKVPSREEVVNNYIEAFKKAYE